MERYNSLLECCKDKFKGEITDLQQFNDGGQKVVFKGIHNKYKKIALKLIHIKSKNVINRTLRELQIATSLKQEYFATVYSYDICKFGSENYIYIIEEFIEGQNLRELLDKEKKIHLQKTVSIGKYILKALIPLHDRKLVHRDIKPENIILTKNGVVLLDFGIARDLGKDSLTADIQLLGPMTVGYAAPEQIKNQKELICNRTDLFAWGIVMYECLEGYNPFKKGCKNVQDIILKSCRYDPPKPDCADKVFSDMIYNSLNKSVHRRPKSCRYILDILN